MLRGVGIRNTRARLEQLYGAQASLILRSLGTRGVVALIFIPLLHTPPLQRPVTVGAIS
jgi:sensor histidine kinase YesM